MDKKLVDKYEKLKKIIKNYGSASVAFSGGVDSTFILKICADLFKNKTLAFTASSDIIPKREIKEAFFVAKDIGVKHIIVDFDILNIPGFSNNPSNRCFLCKTAIFSELKKISEKYGFKHVFDGSNLDDLNDYRPGRDAAKQLGVISPLEDAGLKKEDIRNLSKMLDLPTWNKPAYACLASRFPYNIKITKTDLQKVESAEEYLWKQGMKIFRVRHHDTVARIELGDKDMLTLFESYDLRKKIIEHFRSLGYKHISLDLEGYRTGSMN